jgi:cellulose synthase/poly-beta-1,6-N-acetylglucosamine synthase-like glycosyltransferase
VDSLGHPTLRRLRRDGFKAGNLNHWLSTYGASYDYFLVLDSDSVVSPSSVTELLLYAEHPDNSRIAIFNTVPSCWNTYARLPRLLSIWIPLKNRIRLILDNLAATTFSNGHSNLHRTRAVLQVGGFDERFVAEDVSLTLHLLRAGFRSVLTNVEGLEAEPEHIYSFVRRQQRWAAQAIEVASADWGVLPPTVRYQMFKLVWKYLNFFPYLAWALLAAWGAHSSWRGFLSTIEHLERLGPWPTVLNLIVLPTLPLVGTFAQLAIFARRSDRILRLMGYLLFSWSLGFYAMFATCSAAAMALSGRKVRFSVTEKDSRSVTLKNVFAFQPILIPFLLVVALGLKQNVAAIPFGLPWFALLFSCPFVVHWSHGGARKSL